MRRTVPSILLATGAVVMLAALPTAQAPTPAVAADVTFTRDIEPIFAKSCWNCHNADAQLADLDLSTREAALRGGEHGAAIVPGNAEQSKLYRMVAGLDSIQMPMDGDKLTPAEIAAIKSWIDRGADWAASASAAPKPAGSNSVLAALENMDITPEQRAYWAFKLPVQAPVPTTVASGIAHPIDRFLESARAKKRLIAAPRADRRTLIRRAYFDLIGLPPTPAQVQAFLDDTSPEAWTRVIDSLLASPHYGERWGRHWLDVARYADSNGFEQDYDRPNAWRYRDYVIAAFNKDKPYNQFLKEQIAGDEMDGKSEETLIATGFLRAGPRVLFREKDNPERRWDYVDDLIATIGRGTLGLTANCARCHNHKFDPISQKDYYSLAAALNGWIEIDVPLAPPDQAEAYKKANKEIDEKIAPLRQEIAAIDKWYRDYKRSEYIKSQYPENVQRAVFKNEAERTPGEQLLASQVLTGGGSNLTPDDIEYLMTAEEQAARKQLTLQIEELDKQRPAPLPMAEIITDGDWRFAPLGRGDETIGCPKCRLPPPDRPNGTYLHEGPGKYEPPPTHFLIRGDPNSKGSLMKPGFITVATYGNPPTEIPRPDGRTSGRRLALAEWIGSSQNPLTARVIVNRAWYHHFGRGIVASIDNFGKMGEQPTHPELLDWLAVEFMNKGWSLKQLHRLMMTSDAYQMVSAFDHGGNLKNDPDNLLLWRFRPQRLDAETIRDAILATSGNINLTMGGPGFFPHVPEAVLKTEQTKGRWDNQPDGPDVWRRSVYVYQRRSLPFPMFETFDHPDMNLSAGARNVSTVPTQALTLLNNPFVVKQAELLAERIAREAPDDLVKQIDLGYQYGLARPPSDLERSLALATVKAGSLVDFTHVLFNMNEFLYMR
jgi:cytochrome c553